MNRYTKQLAGGAVAGLLFWASATPALAQARPALIRDVDRPSSQPVHASCATTGTALHYKCTLLTVPAGKRLVVQTVSYEVTTLSYEQPSQIIFFRDASTTPIGLARGDNYLLLTPVLASTPGNRVYQATQAVTMYLDENETLAGGASGGSAFPLAYSFTFQGYLVDK